MIIPWKDPKGFIVNAAVESFVRHDPGKGARIQNVLKKILPLDFLNINHIPVCLRRIMKHVYRTTAPVFQRFQQGHGRGIGNFFWLLRQLRQHEQHVGAAGECLLCTEVDASAEAEVRRSSDQNPTVLRCDSGECLSLWLMASTMRPNPRT